MIFSTKPWLIVIAAFCLLLSGQTAIDSPETKLGQWKAWKVDSYAARRAQVGMAPADFAAFQRSMLALSELVRATKSLNPPYGHNPQLRGWVETPNLPDGRRGRPFAGGVVFAPYYFSVSRSVPPGDPRRIVAVGATNDIEFHLNQIDTNSLTIGIGGARWSDEQGDIFALPEALPPFHGFPRYDDMIVVTRSKRPLFVPVNCERFLRAVIAQRRAVLAERETGEAQRLAQLATELTPAAKALRRKQREEAIAEIQKVNPGMVAELRKGFEQSEKGLEEANRQRLAVSMRDQKWYQEMVAGVARLEKEFDSLPAADRVQPAFYSSPKNPYGSGLVPSGSPKAAPLVTQNPGLFDPAKPRTSIQVILVSGISRSEREFQRNPKSIWARANLAVVQELEWDKVLELMDQPH